MNIGICSNRSASTKINRLELIKELQINGYNVFLIGVDDGSIPHEDYKKHGVQFVGLPLKVRNSNPVIELLDMFRCAKILKRINLDVIWIYGVRMFPLITFSSAIARIPMCIGVVNGAGRLFHFKGLKGNLVRLISYWPLKLALSKMNSVFFQNTTDQELFLQKKILCNVRNIRVNGSGVNVDVFNYSVPKVNPVEFVFVGRLTGRKGVNELLEASKILKAKNLQFKVTIIGGVDDDEQGLRTDLLAACVEENIVSYVGQVSDVRCFLRSSSVFVLPSYYPEGVPRSILEAMATGRAVITTRTPGCVDTVENLANGLLIEPKSVGELCQAMEYMINNPEHIVKMGRESRRICLERFDVHQVNREMLRFCGLT